MKLRRDLHLPDIIAGMDNLAYHSLLIGYYCLIVPSEVKLGPPPISLEELSKNRLIFLDHRWCPPTQDKLQKEICRNNYSLDLAYVNNIATARAMVKARLGWGIWANFVSDPNDLDLKELPVSTKIVPDYDVAILKQGSPQAARRLSAGWRRLDCQVEITKIPHTCHAANTGIFVFEKSLRTVQTPRPFWKTCFRFKQTCS